jgi:hypothetical protein
MRVEARIWRTAPISGAPKLGALIEINKKRPWRSTRETFDKIRVFCEPAIQA